jgi:hypothetical protein
MRNIDFDLGFVLDREKLDRYINNHTSYFSLLETSIGYTGVNIKIPILQPIDELEVKELIFTDEGIKSRFVPYKKHLSTLKEKEYDKKMMKERFNTFLVFQSGKVIMSSVNKNFAREPYYKFWEIIKVNRDDFEEKLS